MADYELYPQIRASFVFTKNDTEDFNRNDVSLRLNLTPTLTRGPEFSKGKAKIYNESNSPSDSDYYSGLSFIPLDSEYYKVLKHACWEIELPLISSEDVESCISKLETLLLGKEKEICDICIEYGVHADLLVHVFALSNSMPYIGLSNKSLSFWASAGVNIIFDFYLD